MLSRITRGGEYMTDAPVDFSDGGTTSVDVRVTRQVTTVEGPYRPSRSYRARQCRRHAARYLALAISSLGVGDETRPDRLEQLRPLATRFTLEHSAPKTVSLRRVDAP
jgi:hypothetical protein